MAFVEAPDTPPANGRGVLPGSKSPEDDFKQAYDSYVLGMQAKEEFETMFPAEHEVCVGGVSCMCGRVI